MKGINFDIKRLEEIVENAPDDHPEDNRPCNCGHCDGYGHVIINNEARPCRFYLKKTQSNKLDRFMKTDHWENWPPPTFLGMRKADYFVETKSFLAMERLFYLIKEGKPYFAIVLCGGYGRGKTLSPLILLNELAQMGRTVTAIKFPDLVDLYKKGYDGKEKLNKLFRNAHRSTVIFIDEIGRESQTGNLDHARYALSEIVNKVCYKKRYLVISTNKRAKEFPQYIEGNLISRLSDSYCKYIEEPFDQDLRKKEELF